jgi:hypothetical protein
LCHQQHQACNFLKNFCHQQLSKQNQKLNHDLLVRGDVTFGREFWPPKLNNKKTSSQIKTKVQSFPHFPVGVVRHAAAQTQLLIQLMS